MVKYLFSISLISLFLVFYSCKSEIKITEKFEIAQPDDSFMITFQQRREVISYFYDTNLNAIVGNNPFENTINFYQIKDNPNQYELVKSTPTNLENYNLIKIEDDKYFFQSDSILLITDTLIQNKKEYPLKHTKKYLKNNFSYYSGNSYRPFLYKGNYYSLFFYRGLKNYYDYFKENNIDVFQFENDHLLFKNSILSQPNDLKNYNNPFPSYCLENDKMIILLKPIDSLYIYDLDSENIRVKKINNPFYKLPEKYDFEKRMESDYTTQYEIDNFTYTNIVFNRNTEHYLLFFQAPYLDQSSEELVYPNNDYVLVLDKDFNYLKTYLIGNIYFPASQGIFIDGRGFVLPITNQDGKTYKCHIFNF